MKVVEAWALLGLEPTEDARAVKRAYGRLLKQIDVDADPAAFIRLREALDLALDWGERLPEWEADGYDDSNAPWESETVLPEEGDGEDDVPADPLAGEFPFAEDAAAGWRPASPPIGEGRLDAACRALDALLFGADTPDPAEVEAAGAALLREAEAAPVGEAVEVERWLQSSLAISIPRSDPLIAPAMRQFGWDNAVRPRDFMSSMDLDALAERRADRAVLQRCLNAAGPDRFAVEELRRPGRTRLGLFELGLAADVRQFLKSVVDPHPTIEHDLDPDTLAWWRGYFRRRHLPDQFWLLLFALPPSFTFFGALILAVPDRSSPVGVASGFGLAFAATLAGLLLFAELRARAAAWHERRRWQEHTGAGLLPWLAAALVLPPAAVAFAVNEWTAIAWNAAALAVAAGGHLHCRPAMADFEMRTPLGPPRVPGVAALAALTILLGMSAVEAAHAGGPLAALCYLAYRCHEAVALKLGGSPARTQRAVIAVAGLASAGATVLLFAFAPGLAPPVLLALVPVATAAAHLATSLLFLASARLEWAIRVAAILFHFTLGAALFAPRSNGLIVAILLYALVYSLVRVILALRQRPAAGPEEPVFF